MLISAVSQPILRILSAREQGLIRVFKHLVSASTCTHHDTPRTIMIQMPPEMRDIMMISMMIEFFSCDDYLICYNHRVPA
jgi:hypothetical protein